MKLTEGPDQHGVEPEFVIVISKESVFKHIATLSEDAREDIANGKWDEVMTDALYAACGASTQEDMDEARSIAESF